ncbi:hypothetical protein Tco_0557931 [Tanacetum coccineum]
MIDELSIVETDKVNHTVEMDMLKLVVEVECFGKCVDEFDKVTVLFGEMQLNQEDAGVYVHASNENFIGMSSCCSNDLSNSSYNLHLFLLFNGRSLLMEQFNLLPKILGYPMLTHRRHSFVGRPWRLILSALMSQSAEWLLPGVEI